MNSPNSLEESADQIVLALEAAIDALEGLRNDAASTRSDARKAEAVALLEARDLGFRSREERDAHATLASADLEATADITERIYRDKLTYIRTLQSQLELIRTRMVTNRDLRV